jgi:hypothetical protein
MLDVSFQVHCAIDGYLHMVRGGIAGHQPEMRAEVPINLAIWRETDKSWSYGPKKIDTLSVRI